MVTAKQVEEISKEKLGRVVRSTVRQELVRLPLIITEGEEILNMSGGHYKGKGGLLILTDRRLIFYEAGVFRQNMQDFAIGSITAVQTESKLTNAKLHVSVSGSEATIEKLLLPRAEEIASYVREAIMNRANKATGNPPPASVDVIAQIQKLAELRDAGVLSSDEFEAKKAELLARL